MIRCAVRAAVGGLTGGEHGDGPALPAGDALLGLGPVVGAGGGHDIIYRLLGLVSRQALFPGLDVPAEGAGQLLDADIEGGAASALGTEV